MSDQQVRMIVLSTDDLAIAVDHPVPGKVVVGIKTDDVDGAAKAIEENGGGKGNGLVFYQPILR